VSNLFSPDFEEPSEQEGFVSRRARVGRQAGAQALGASVYELPPGQAAWPYHAHLANEEMLVVLEGRPSLRTPDGWCELDEGELVAFVTGSEGAHQVVNRSDRPVRFLMLSEMNAPEIALYPDSGKVGLFGRAPGSADKGFTEYLRRDAQAGYWEGEEPPAAG
jgi:uncharacterized cupin superfamily protein